MFDWFESKPLRRDKTPTPLWTYETKPFSLPTDEELREDRNAYAYLQPLRRGKSELVRMVAGVVSGDGVTSARVKTKLTGFRSSVCAPRYEWKVAT